MGKLIKAEKAKRKEERKVKTFKDEYYTVQSILGNDWAIFFCLLGGRETGKSYTVMDWAVKNKVKKGEGFKFYWMRLTETATDNLLLNNGDKLIDPDLKRKYGIQLTRKGTTLYTYDEEKKVSTKTGKETVKKVNLVPFVDVLACSTFYNTKGVGYYDNEFKGEYCIVLDEMNREESEKNNFDVVYNFVNLIENIARSTKTRIKVFMIGNTLDEASDILSAFNFIPDDFGRYKLKSKRAVIDYIKPSEKYLERRKGTISDILSPDASTFTNEVQLDKTLIVSRKRRKRPTRVVMFSKKKEDWFTLWDGNIISPYVSEKVPPLAMRRYLDVLYDPSACKSVQEAFDGRAFRFDSVSVMRRFQKALRLLRK